MARYAFLKTAGLSLDSIWQWSKRLIEELNKAEKESDVPAGVVVPYAGLVAPLGWLLCDGGLYSRYEYPVLFAAIDHIWGGEGDFFNVPDFRDRYLAGAGSVFELTELGGGESSAFTAGTVPSSTGLPPSVGINFIIKA